MRQKILMPLTLFFLLVMMLRVDGGNLRGFESLPYHDPIRIASELEFTTENGITGGSGTTEDPYVIEGWDINASTAHGIHIENTRVYFIIRKVWVHHGRWDYPSTYGVFLKNVSNGKIENIRVNNVPYGIMLASSSYNNVSGNTVSDCWDGIYIYFHSDHNIVSNNNVYDQGQTGIHIKSSDYNQVLNNIISNNGLHGIIVDEYANYNTIAYNQVFNNKICGIIVDYDSHFNKIIGNTIVGNDVGVEIGSIPIVPHNIDIYWNNFINNGRQVIVSPESFQIAWNFGGKGNYWSDYFGIDIDGDGVGETIYVINSRNRDDYPLTDLFSPYIPEKRPLGLWWLWITAGLGTIITVAASLTVKTRVYRLSLEGALPVVVNILLVISTITYLFSSLRI